MKIDFEDIKRDIVKRVLFLDEYIYLKDRLNFVDISSDREFQNKFNRFYRVRRDANWRKEFYIFFETIKRNKEIEFDDILQYFYVKTGNIEASFSSKMLAILRPDKPIWDKYVLARLGLKLSGLTQEEKLKNAKEIYKEIETKEREMLKDKDIRRAVDEFRKYFSEYNLTDIKILDYLLWVNR